MTLIAEEISLKLSPEDSPLKNLRIITTYEYILIPWWQVREKARVVICFCFGDTVTGLLNASVRLNATNELLIVGRCVASADL